MSVVIKNEQFAGFISETLLDSCSKPRKKLKARLIAFDKPNGQIEMHTSFVVTDALDREISITDHISSAIKAFNQIRL
jgi:hypothetical protein